jgi:hypothetical protein
MIEEVNSVCHDYTLGVKVIPPRVAVHPLGVATVISILVAEVSATLTKQFLAIISSSYQTLAFYSYGVQAVLYYGPFE